MAVRGKTSEEATPVIQEREDGGLDQVAVVEVMASGQMLDMF